ncbi:MAG: hypothetical protein IKA77_05520 [Clostridia bacterium]|nr:hypothetical protein [Clostridia bacterium]
MIKVLAIFGGQSTEHDISVITAIEALNSMPFSGYKTYPVYLRKGVWYGGDALYDLKNYVDFDAKIHKKLRLIGKNLYEEKRNKLKFVTEVDCALLLTHGGEGEDGALQGFLEVSGVPFTSSGVGECALTIDKYLTKLALRDAGVKVVDGLKVDDFSEESIKNVEKSIGYPVFVKPNSQGSSIGVGLAEDKNTLTEKVKVALEYDSSALVEKYQSNCLELNCAVYSDGENYHLSEVEKPLGAKEFLTFQNKYLDGVKGGMSNCGREFPAKINDSLREKIQNTSLYVYKKLNLFGVVRFDYMYTEELYLNEINAIPGSLAHYLFPNLSYTEFLKSLIDGAIKKGLPVRKSFESQVLKVGRGKG